MSELLEQWNALRISLRDKRREIGLQLAHFGFHLKEINRNFAIYEYPEMGERCLLDLRLEDFDDEDSVMKSLEQVLAQFQVSEAELQTWIDEAQFPRPLGTDVWSTNALTDFLKNVSVSRIADSLAMEPDTVTWLMKEPGFSLFDSGIVGKYRLERYGYWFRSHYAEQF